MKKLLILLFVALSLHANEASVAAKKLGYINSFDKGIAQAKKEKKIMMLVLVRDGCPWCKRLENDTLSDSFVLDETKNFVNVLIDRNAKMPDYYRTPIVPVVYFVNPETKESMFETAGYRDPVEFLEDIENAKHEFSKLKK